MDNMSIDKKDPTKDESDDSMESSPDDDHNQHSINGSNNASTSVTTSTQDIQAPKRKGGRKPIYATSEERKQRNRQAQAAFRERRTEYIKQLEETIRVHESNLHNLQTAHRSAADECLMLRYKNSLLERILLEKGIDVQAELRDKTGSPTLGPTHVPQNMVQPPSIHRTILNRQQSRRSTSSIAPKIEPGIAALPPPSHAHSSAASPKSQPTPSTHSHSPTAAGARYGSQMGTVAMGADPTGLRVAMPMKQMPAISTTAVRPMAPAVSGFRVGPGSGSFYPTPSFQNHIEQLEQEYDAQADMIDDPEAETPGPGPYPASYANDPQPMAVSPTVATPVSTGVAPTIPHLPPAGVGHSQAPPLSAGGQYPSMTQLLDPSMDWDPFGLSASMQFPTQFSFDTSNMR